MDRSVRQSMDPVRSGGGPWTGGQCFRVTLFFLFQCSLRSGTDPLFDFGTRSNLVKSDSHELFLNLNLSIFIYFQKALIISFFFFSFVAYL